MRGAEDENVIAYVHPKGAEQSNYKSALIRRFDFTSALMRMSVICQNRIDNKYRVFVKGSPEKIQELCNSETIPQEYFDVMSNYTKEGYRVIGFATKVLEDFSYKEVMRIERLDCEKQLTFLGLLVMENKLKKETNGVIQVLNDCKIRTIMATGDNVLTAISVARQCSILNQENEVFLGELIKDPQNGLERIEWTSTTPVREDFGAVENKRRTLVRNTMTRNDGF